MIPISTSCCISAGNGSASSQDVSLTHIRLPSCSRSLRIQPSPQGVVGMFHSQAVLEFVVESELATRLSLHPSKYNSAVATPMSSKYCISAGSGFASSQDVSLTHVKLPSASLSLRIQPSPQGVVNSMPHSHGVVELVVAIEDPAREARNIVL